MNKLFTVLSLLFVFVFVQKNNVIYAQHTISGVVLGIDRSEAADDDEEVEITEMPMPAALVSLPHLGVQTITDNNGRFSLQTDADSCLLEVSYTFYESEIEYNI